MDRSSLCLLSNRSFFGIYQGVELAGCADMGGLEFFTTQIESAEGDLVLLQSAMDAANKEVSTTSRSP